MKKLGLLCMILCCVGSFEGSAAQGYSTGTPEGDRANTRGLSTNRHTIRPAKHNKKDTKKIRQAKPKPAYQ